MLHYKNRRNQIHIFSLDRRLLDDIDERLADVSRLRSVTRIKPAAGGTDLVPEDILTLARDTVNARVLILDVRNQTLAQLQRAYSDIIRFNRPDLNRWCNCILVGDGPRNFLHSTGGKKALPAYLADLRVNYSAMAFFGDPFLHYHEEELLTMTRERNFLPDRLSQRFEKYFKDETPSIDQLRRYFRAANREGDEKKTAKKERRRILKKLVSKIILDEFPEDKELVRHALSKEGLSVPGESLTFNIYPFYFEERVLEALKLAQSAALES